MNPLPLLFAYTIGDLISQTMHPMGDIIHYWALLLFAAQITKLRDSSAALKLYELYKVGRNHKLVSPGQATFFQYCIDIFDIDYCIMNDRSILLALYSHQ